jgi:8-oxo-dGTP pyrophosphatase MutT (NUDIX family)
MHRNQLLNLLNNYHSENIKEQEYKEKIITFIKNNENCFDRSNGKGHITASAWVINKDRNKVLLMLHKKLNRWLQLGGHADGESDVTLVALKEAREESGIQEIHLISNKIFDIDIHKIPAHKDIPEHLHYDIRFILETEHENFIQNNESIALAWFSQNIEKFPNKSESMMRMFFKWQAKFSII